MRHGRAKQARKTLQFFERAAGLKNPYHVLLDGTFVVAMVKYAVPLGDRLQRLLSRYTLYVCTSTLTELKALRDAQSQSDKRDMFRQSIAWCGEHCQTVERLPNDENDTIKNLSAAATDVWHLATVQNRSLDNCADAAAVVDQKKQPYIICSQDEELLDRLRRHSLTPIVRLARGSVLLLEQPSKHALRIMGQQERQKYRSNVTVNEQTMVNIAKKEARSAAGTAHHEQRRPKKAKGPNPLSCKKRTTKGSESGKRKRQRNK